MCQAAALVLLISMGKSEFAQFSHLISFQGHTPRLLARYSGEVQAKLTSIFGEGNQGLYDLQRYHLGWTTQDGERLPEIESQGKFLRSSLCLFACHALGGEWEKTIPIALSLELIHNFSLIHDDIQDGDLYRRHRPTVWSLWGRPKALVAGNCMRAISHRASLADLDSQLSSGKILKCSSLLIKGELDMITGQCLDLSYEASMNVTLESYKDMISYKTGALINCSLAMGALLASDDESYVSSFARYGNHIGRIFQIRDDILGIWGKKGYTGKTTGNDIRRKKKSFPIVFAFEKSSGELEDIYQKETLDDDDVDRVLTILHEVGAREKAQEIIENEAGVALSELEHVPLPAWAIEEAKDLEQFLIRREH